jgi:hypothetical protein
LFKRPFSTTDTYRPTAHTLRAKEMRRTSASSKALENSPGIL